MGQRRVGGEKRAAAIPPARPPPDPRMAAPRTTAHRRRTVIMARGCGRGMGAPAKLRSTAARAKRRVLRRTPERRLERNGLFDLIQGETGPADTILDLGCGILHQTTCRRYGPGLPDDGVFSMIECGGYLGCDLFDRYLDVVKRHVPTVRLDASEAGERFRPYSYDVVIALDVVEHLEPAAARRLAADMKSIARKAAIIFTPSDPVSNEDSVRGAWGLGHNPLQRHRCYLPADWLAGEGYACTFPKALAGNTVAVWRRGPGDTAPDDPYVRLPNP